MNRLLIRRWLWLGALLGCALLGRADELDEVVVELNVASKQPVHRDQLFFELSHEMDVPSMTLRHRWATCRRGFGEFYIAHLISKETGQSYEIILDKRDHGWGWGQIARHHQLKVGPIVSRARKSEAALKPHVDFRKDPFFPFTTPPGPKRSGDPGPGSRAKGSTGGKGKKK